MAEPQSYVRLVTLRGSVFDLQLHIDFNVWLKMVKADGAVLMGDAGQIPGVVLPITAIETIQRSDKPFQAMQTVGTMLTQGNA